MRACRVANALCPSRALPESTLIRGMKRIKQMHSPERIVDCNGFRNHVNASQSESSPIITNNPFFPTHDSFGEPHISFPIYSVDHSVFRVGFGEAQRASRGLTCFAYEPHLSWLRGSKWVRALPGQKGGLPNVPQRSPRTPRGGEFRAGSDPEPYAGLGGSRRGS